MNLRACLYPALRSVRKLRFSLSRASKDGYDQDLLAREVIGRDAADLQHRRYTTCLLEQMIEHVPGEVGKVLDFGGGGGRHGFAFLAKETTHWTVVETSAMAAAGKALIDESRISFHESIAAAKKELQTFDVVHVSSALQYTPHPLGYLQELLALKPKAILLEKLVFTTRQEPISFLQYSMLRDNLPSISSGQEVQNVPIRYRLSAMTLESFEEAIGLDYRVVAQWQDGAQSHLPSLKGLKQDGFFLVRKFSDSGVRNS